MTATLFFIFFLLAATGALVLLGKKPALLALSSMLFFSCAAFGQRSNELAPRFSRFEVGAEASGIYREASNVSAGSTPGLGGRFVYNLYLTEQPSSPSLVLSLEADLHYFPMNETPSIISGGSAIAGIFGPKFGVRGKRWGSFVKVRPGFVSYSNAILGGNSAAGAPLQTGRFTNPAIDAGAVFEYYPVAHWTLRFDAGDTVVFFQNNIIGSDGKPLKRTDNFQPGLSVMYTF